MSNNEEEILGTPEDSGNALLGMDINQLRASCKLFGIAASKDWKKEDYLRAIQEKVKHVEMITAAKADADKNAPPPGYSRIVVHKDPSPNSSNTAVPAAVNGRIFLIPRGVEVLLPNPVVEVIKNSRTHSTQNTNPNAANMADERYEHVESVAYPYSVLAVTDGPYYNANDQRIKTYRLREAFLAKFGKWPTTAELNTAISNGVIDGRIA